jgi:hypothetical protein
MSGSPGWLRHPLEPIDKPPKLPQKVWERLTEWRRTWSELWYLEIRGRHYVYRSPTRQDCIDHDLNMKTMPTRAIDDFVCRCVLYPEELPADLPATDVETLYEAMWSVSGFRDPEAFDTKLALFDNVSRSPEQENILLLMKAFPGLLPDKINSWQPEKIIYHIALARILLGLEPLPMPVEAAEELQGPAQAPERRTFDWEQDLQEWKAFERS